MSGSKDPPDFYSQGLKDNRICKLSRPYTVIASDRRARGDLGGNASGSISMTACSFCLFFCLNCFVVPPRNDGKRVEV
jgi:hypothetical protein